MELKNLKNEILAALLQGTLTETDLNGLATIAALSKAQGVDVIVNLPTEPVKKASDHARNYTKHFLGSDASETDVNALALKLDTFFADTEIPRTSDKKIHNIKRCRELTGLGLADSKWLVENAFGL